MTKQEQTARTNMQKALREFLKASRVLHHCWSEVEGESNSAECVPHPFHKHYPFGDKNIEELDIEKWVNTTIDTLNRPFVSKPILNGIDDDETVIASIETQQTGGHVYNDVITLKDGIVIRISDGGLSVFKNADADDNNEEHAFVDFPVTDKS